MDIKCTNCGEPWESYHLRWDLIYETYLYSDGYEKLVESLREKMDLSDPLLRKALKEIGWEFGNTIYNIKRCSACSWHEKEGHEVGSKRNKDLSALTDAAEELLGYDEDGLVSTLEDIEMFLEDK